MHYDLYLSAAPRDARQRPNTLYCLAGCFGTALALRTAAALAELEWLLQILELAASSLSKPLSRSSRAGGGPA
jgi:hypothetical protein